MKYIIKLKIKYKKKVCSYHAEVNVCKDLSSKDLYGSTIYVARINNNGEIRNSHPCKACSKFLIRKGVRRIYYTTSE